MSGPGNGDDAPDGPKRASASSPDQSNRQLRGDYEIGYGRPPKHTQFGPTNPGNRAGRKPGSKNLEALIKAELDTKVGVTDKGRRRTLTKRALIIRQLTDRAAGADLKAIGMLLAMVQQFEVSAPQPAARTLTADDQAVLKGLRKRLFGEGDGDA